MAAVVVVAMQGVVPENGALTEQIVSVVANLLGLGIVAGSLSGTVALLYRWYVRERVPAGLAILVGLSAVAILMSTTTALGQVIGQRDDVLEAEAILANLGAFVVGGVGAYTGIRLGDRVGTDLFAATGGREIDADVSEIVRTVGRVTSVTLPEEIEDIVGYDPMPEETKEKLAGRRFLFPRRLTKADLRKRLISRLTVDYGVGHVDLELSGDGTVEYLAVGSRAAGIGPTLPPATNAVAIRADPANAASAGDLVQVWETNPLRRVLTGELRGVAGEIVTVAIDAADTQKVDPSQQYKLVTLPVQDRPDREFASLLRAADETLGTVTVEPGSDLDGVTIGALQATVVAITREDAKPEPIPGRSRVLSAGDVLYAIATPETLRRLEAAAVGTAPTEVDTGGEPPVAPVPAGDADEDAGVAGPPAAGDPEEAGSDDGSRPAEDTPTEPRSDTDDASPEPATEPDRPADTDHDRIDVSAGEQSADSDEAADDARSTDADTADTEPSVDEAAGDPAEQSLVDVLGGTPDESDTDDEQPGADDAGDTTTDEDSAGSDTDGETDPAEGSVVEEPDAPAGTATDTDSEESEADLLDSFADEDTEAVDGPPVEPTTDPAVDTADTIFESLNEGDDEDVDLDSLLQGDEDDVAVWDPDADGPSETDAGGDDTETDADASEDDTPGGPETDDDTDRD